MGGLVVRTILLLALILGGSCLRAEPQDWPSAAVWYQIFPERFRNGDPKNDPTAEYSRVPEKVRSRWQITPWTQEWYALAEWERELSGDVYGSNAHRRHGGDFQGIIDKLDYLKDLGVNALYLNPVFESSSLHKYDARSFHHADPHFGPDPEGDKILLAGETADPATWKWTAADKLLLELIRQAHQRGMRVILDGVFNHCAPDFFAFADLKTRQKDSAYLHWFEVRSFDNPKTKQDEFDYAGWWGLKSMPEFAEVQDEKGRKNLHPDVKAYIFAITQRWMDPDGDGDPSDGVDGWRLDVANEVGTGFWQEWNQRVKSINPGAYTTAEIWVEAPSFMREAGFDAVMNYYGFAMPVKGGLIDATLPVREFTRLLHDRREQFTPQETVRLMNLLDSHDTDRAASMIVNRDRPYYAKADAFAYDAENWAGNAEKPYLVRKPDEREKKLLRMILLFQVAYPGAPYLYYGTEAGMWGADDPDNRMPMAWDDLKLEPQTISPGRQGARKDDGNFDASLHAYTREALALRQKVPTLISGTLQPLGANNATRMFAFARSGEGQESVVAVFNRHDKPQTFSLQQKSADGGPTQPLAPFFTSSGPLSEISLIQEREKISVTVPGWTGVLLK